MNKCRWINSFQAILYTLFFTVFFSLTSWAQVVDLTLPDVTGKPGEVVTVPIIISNASGVIGTRIEINIPNTNADYPIELINVLHQNALARDFFVTVFDNTTTTGRLIITAAGNFALLEESGALFNINLRIKPGTFGQTLDLNFISNNNLNDGQIPVNLVNGQITIDAPVAIPTDTPTPTPTPTQTFTPTQTPTQTPTFDPFQTPATATPRPSNQSPTITVEPADRFVVQQGQPLDILVIASDENGDDLDIFLSLNARATLKSSEQLPTSKLEEYSLDTSILGDSSFIIFASDGDLVASKEVFLSVVSSLTPLPSQTPSPKEVLVTDNLLTNDDLTGSTDFDDENDRQLTIRWNAAGLTAMNWHVYVQSGFGTREFLGSTGSGDIKQLNWAPNAPLINSLFAGGPQFGNFYTFTVIRIDAVNSPDDYFSTTAPVGFNNTGGGAVPLPNTTVAVTDDAASTADLSGQTDFDAPENRQLTIRWLASAKNAVNWHIYVRHGFGEFEFLGQTGTGFSDHFSWFPNAPQLNPEFIDGPQFNSIYQFEVIRLDGNLGDDDILTQTSHVGFNFIGGSPLTIRENPVKVVDDFFGTRDLTGMTDFDNSDERVLTIKWSQPSGNATDWHIYIREGLGGRKFLGRTGNGTVQFFEWFPNSPNTNPEYKAGPQFNKTYNFRVIRIDSSFSMEDVFDQPFSVGYSQTGTEEVALIMPEAPNLSGRRIAIYDDILASDDLAPIGNIGSDSDSPERRFIHIAWNFNDDTSIIYDYHVEVSVNGGGFQFLGQTQDNLQQYFWWSAENLFKTAAQFANGPQNGNDYQFRVSRRDPKSQRDLLTSGVLTYEVKSPVINPTATPQLPFPTFTPTPTATATLTPTATQTPTPTPTPLELPFTFKSVDATGDTLELVLPGIVNQIKPLRLKLIRLGRFDMGSPDTERGRKSDETLITSVDITQNFYIGQFEVTQAQWQSVIGTNPAWFNDHFNNPVESVSWSSVQLFLNAINQQVDQGLFRLPTEAEWEYAARGRTQTRFSFGSASECADTGAVFCSLMDQFMWWLGNNTSGTNLYGSKQVGLKQPNPFGLYDMHGNVREWCQDRYGAYNPNTKINPTGPITGTNRVARGGAWSDDASFCRSAKRHSLPPSGQFVNVGFRVVWQIKKPEETTE